MPDWKNFHTFLLVVVLVVGGTIGATGYFAKAEHLKLTDEHLKLTDMRLEQKIQQDRYWWLKARFEKLQKAFPANRPAPQAVREEMGNLDREIKEIEKPKEVGRP